MGDRTKVLVAALAAPSVLALGLGTAVATGAAFVFLWWWLAIPLALAGGWLTLNRAAAIAAGPGFARQALEAADMGRSALGGGGKLYVLAEFKVGMDPALKAQAVALHKLASEVEGRIEKGAGTWLDGAMRAMAPEVRATLDEAAALLEAGHARSPGKADPETLARAAKLAKILESMRSDLIQMEEDPTALPGDRLRLKLEDLSGAVKQLGPAGGSREG